MPFRHQLFSQKSSVIAVIYNPKYASDIFYGFYCNTAILFTAAVFKDVSEDLILSYDLNIFFTTLYMGRYYHG